MAEAARANIVDLNDYRTTAGGKSANLVLKGKESDSSNASPSPGIVRTSMEDLYGEAAGAQSGVIAARHLLNECIQKLDAAIRLHVEGDVVGSDLEVSRTLAEWPQVFSFRDLSRGYATLSLGIFYALQNASTDVLAIDQLISVHRATELLRDNPFVNFEQALDALDDLEERGLIIDPHEATALGEIFVESISGYDDTSRRVT